MATPTPAHALTLRNTSNNLGLVGYWSLNDATGTLATDFSGRGNTGTLTNMEVGDWTTGKKGTALSFDGVNEYVYKATFASIPTSQMTISAWIKNSSGSGGIIFTINRSPSNYQNQGVLQFFTGGKIQFWDYATSDYGFPQSGSSDTSITDGNWHHVAFVKSGTSGTYYTDGVADGTTTASQNVTYVGNDFVLGANIRDSASYFPGSMDEVRIYNRALGASEVYSLYSGGIARVTGANDLGLVGYWPFDEATGTIATDFSGSGNTATLTGGPTWTNGKRGKALQFDGVDDYIRRAYPAATNIPSKGPMTISAWIYKGVGGGGTVTEAWCGAAPHGCDFIVTDSGGYLKASNYALYSVTCTDASSKINEWYNLVLTMDGTTETCYINGAQNGTGTFQFSNVNNNVDFVIGAHEIDTGSPTFFNGKIDDLRIYNRALSAAEVQSLYNATKVGAVRVTPVSDRGLVGYWNFDEGVGTKMGDFSGQGNTGTLTNMEAADWVAGKRGKALSFDGTNEYVLGPKADVLRSMSSLTVSAWAKRTAGTGGSLVTYDGGSWGAWRLDFGGASVSNGSSWNAVSATTSLQDGQWYLITGVWTGSLVKIYINGVEENSAAASITLHGTDAEDQIRIGRGGWDGGPGYFNGLVDDVRVYNRVLSAAEIQTLYSIGR